MSLAVLPEHRGRGIGARLLDAVSGEAAAAGLSALALDVAADNEAAIRFYVREGFHRVSEAHIPASRRTPALGVVRMERPVVVLLLFALHHKPYEAQGKVLTEAARLSKRRVIVLEDTPMSRADLRWNTFWDKVLNLRHRVPTPCAFRSVDEWEPVFMEHGLGI